MRLDMDQKNRIYIAGHRGLVGSALLQKLQADGYSHLITRTRSELDLTDGSKVDRFFKMERPEYVFLAAARVGGIEANRSFPAEFILENMMIQSSVIRASHSHGVQRLIFFGSNCAYPKNCPQPMKEEYILSGRLEPTSLPYAVAKIAGMKMCEAYNRQYGTLFVSVIPATLYGPRDNFDPQTSHVLSALIHKFHEAVSGGEEQVVVWGSGKPRREFLYVGDLVDACFVLMKLDSKILRSAIEQSNFVINVGPGTDIRMMDLANLIRKSMDCSAELTLDPSKPDGTPRRLLDSRSIRALGWMPRVSLEEGIRKTYDWYKKTEIKIKDPVR